MGMLKGGACPRRRPPMERSLFCTPSGPTSPGTLRSPPGARLRRSRRPPKEVTQDPGTRQHLCRARQRRNCGRRAPSSCSPRPRQVSTPWNRNCARPGAGACLGAIRGEPSAQGSRAPGVLHSLSEPFPLSVVTRHPAEFCLISRGACERIQNRRGHGWQESMA